MEPESIDAGNGVEITPVEPVSQEITPIEAPLAEDFAAPEPISEDSPASVQENALEVANPAVVEAVEPWVGEISKLDELDWYKGLPPHQRKSLSEGLATVRKNMDRAFHQKSADLKAQREALDSREKLILGIARGDLDAEQTIEEAVEAKLTERLATMTAELATLKENRADPEEIKEAKAAKDALQAALDEIQATYQQTATELEAYREVVRKVEAEKSKAETDRILDFLEKNAPDLIENDAALSRFMASEDFDEGEFDLALKYARLKYPAPPKEAKPAAPAKKEVKPAETPPVAMGLMGEGGAPSEATAGGKTVHSRYNPVDDVDAEIRRLRAARGG